MSRSLLLSLAGLLLCACHKEEPPAAISPPSVRIVTVAPRLVRLRLPLSGVLAPLPGRDIKVGALVPGRVDRVFVAEGDLVRSDQPLAHVEAQPLRYRITETEAQREQAKAALDNARTRLARSQRLWQDGIAARQEVDDAQAALVAAESALRQAQAQGGTASMQLDRATLRAPFDGVVAAVIVPAGQPVDGSGTPVIEVADTRQLDLRAPVPAARIGEISVGDQAEIHLEGLGPGLGTVRGAVFAIAPLVDTATSTVLVRVRIDNPDGRLRGGMFATGVLLGPELERLVVPRSALLPGDGGAANQVAVVQPDGTVAHRVLRLGLDIQGQDLVPVLAGLTSGERVIIAGGYSLPDGVKVEIVP